MVRRDVSGLSRGRRPEKVYPRRSFLTLAGALGVAFMLRPISGDLALPPESQEQLDKVSRAVQAYSAMGRAFGDPLLYFDTYPRADGDPSAAGLATNWSYSISTSATLDMLGLPAQGKYYRTDVEKNLGGLRLYSRETGPIVRAGFGPTPIYQAPQGAVEVFNDDNAWIGLNLVRAYRMLGPDSQVQPYSGLLEQAEALLDFILESQAAPGERGPRGIFWKRQYEFETNHEINTVSSAPPAQLAARLYLETGRQYYLDKAIELYGWVNRAMRDSDLLYWDNVNEHGRIDKTKYSYNQGSMIGLKALLFAATGETVFLQAAEATAEAVLDRFLAGGFSDKIPEFDYIMFKNLLFLSAHSQREDLRRQIQAALNAHLRQLWEDPAHHTQKGLFSFAGETYYLIQQAAVTGMLALAAWPPKHYPRLY